MGQFPSIRTLYRIGVGPSASHTMGPRHAALRFSDQLGSDAEKASIRVTLYGSLAATGRGHMTDLAIADALQPIPLEVIWQADKTLPGHPNGMRFEALNAEGEVTSSWEGYSPGGGRIATLEELARPDPPLYDVASIEDLLAHHPGDDPWRAAWAVEGEALTPFLQHVWQTMRAAIQRGLSTDGVLPGPLHLARRARNVLNRSRKGLSSGRTGVIAAYALAVSEENAASGTICAAPTCGSCGVIPAVFHFLERRFEFDEPAILDALAVAGLFGLSVRENASISGAEVGCQGEIGTACAMAAAGAAYLLGGSPRQVEYAAEMGLEHLLGMTCDPIAGLVQIPCIERNAMAAMRALNCAEYAILTEGEHRVSFDQVVRVMNATGRDIPSLYRETSQGGLATLGGGMDDG